MIYNKLAELIRIQLKQINQWKSGESGNRKPPYVKLYSTYTEFSIACNTLNLTNRNMYIIRLARIFSELIESIKNVNTLESVKDQLDDDTIAQANKILREQFSGGEGRVFRAIVEMCGPVGKFMEGSLHCYGLLANEMNHDFNHIMDLETYRKACTLLDEWAEQIESENEILELPGPVLRIGEVIDNICNNFVDGIESIDKYRTYKGQPLAKAHHYAEAEDAIHGIEDDIETLLAHFIVKTSQNKANL